MSASINTLLQDLSWDLFRIRAQSDTAPRLELRDVHLPAAPSWWPPAHGWWLLAAALLAIAGVLLWRRWRKQRRQRAILRIFDEEIEVVSDTPAKIAKMSELLRRAGRLSDVSADHLHGEEWLKFLDRGQATPTFSAGVGQTLLEGGFRRTVPEFEMQALQHVVRTRFLSLMENAKSNAHRKTVPRKSMRT